jgi:hypothetical protein
LINEDVEAGDLFRVKSGLRRPLIPLPSLMTLGPPVEAGLASEGFLVSDAAEEAASAASSAMSAGSDADSVVCLGLAGIELGWLGCFLCLFSDLFKVVRNNHGDLNDSTSHFLRWKFCIVGLN